MHAGYSGERRYVVYLSCCDVIKPSYIFETTHQIHLPNTHNSHFQQTFQNITQLLLMTLCGEHCWIEAEFVYVKCFCRYGQITPNNKAPFTGSPNYSYVHFVWLTESSRVRPVVNYRPNDHHNVSAIATTIGREEKFRYPRNSDKTNGFWKGTAQCDCALSANQFNEICIMNGELDDDRHSVVAWRNHADDHKVYASYRRLPETEMRNSEAPNAWIFARHAAHAFTYFRHCSLIRSGSLVPWHPQGAHSAFPFHLYGAQ